MTEAPAPADVARAMLTFDPTSAEYHADPYNEYRKARELGDVVRSPLGMWVLTRYRDCAVALRDPRFGWGDGALTEEVTTTHFATNPDGSKVRPFNFMDPPDHTRIRSLVNKTFTARRVELLRERAQELVEELLEHALARAGDEPIDLMSSIASPVPALVLGSLMGVAAEDEAWFRELCADIERGLDLGIFLTPEEISRRDNARTKLTEYFGELAEARRAEPADDLVSELVAVEEEGERLTNAELRVNCTLLLSAGYVTTVNLIGNGMQALLRNPDQLSWLREHPDQIANAVEELLRYDGPSQMVGRVVLEDTEIGGQAVSKGDVLMVIIGSANHDPEVYEEPDKLDLSRSAGRNLGFGLGIHFCIGAPLARMVTQVVIGELIKRDITLATDRHLGSESITIRGLAELPVTVRR